MTLKADGEYLIPKCSKHKKYMKICQSTSKRYPRTFGFYCDKCGDDLVDSFGERYETNL